jgi:hypothetical protein
METIVEHAQGLIHSLLRLKCPFSLEFRIADQLLMGYYGESIPFYKDFYVSSTGLRDAAANVSKTLRGCLKSPVASSQRLDPPFLYAQRALSPLKKGDFESGSPLFSSAAAR